jgi:hypothetical protein
MVVYKKTGVVVITSELLLQTITKSRRGATINNLMQGRGATEGDSDEDCNASSEAA